MYKSKILIVIENVMFSFFIVNVFLKSSFAIQFGVFLFSFLFFLNLCNIFKNFVLISEIKDNSVGMKDEVVSLLKRYEEKHLNNYSLKKYIVNIFLMSIVSIIMIMHGHYILILLYWLTLFIEIEYKNKLYKLI